jgi:ribonuclease HI
MTILAHTDGASRGNPGASGIGVVVRTEDGTVLGTASGFLGTATNNVAEYTALLICLRAVAQLPCTRLIVHADSELMVRQLNGQYKVRDARLKKYVDDVRAILKNAPYTFEIRHILREANADADELANAGIDGGKPVHVSWAADAPVQQTVK